MVVVSTGTAAERELDGEQREPEKRTEARMTVVDHHIAAEGPGSVVVDAAGAVGDVAHDHALGAAEALDDIDNRTTVHEQSLRHLQRHPARPVLLDLRDRLGDLEAVVRREEMRNRTQ